MPTEIEIRSHRPYIGWAIVAYKKLIRLAIGPYLNSFLEAEEASLRKETQRQAKEFEKIAEDVMRRTNALFAVLDRRVEELEKKLDGRKGS